MRNFDITTPDAQQESAESPEVRVGMNMPEVMDEMSLENNSSGGDLMPPRQKLTSNWWLYFSYYWFAHWGFAVTAQYKRQQTASYVECEPRRSKFAH